jgi:hypothetical protein
MLPGAHERRRDWSAELRRWKFVDIHETAWNGQLLFSPP